MDAKKHISAKRAVFVILFLAMVFIGNRINFSPLVGADNQFFTLYQFFGPIAGGFLGPLFGIVAVFGAQLADAVVMGKAFTLVNVARFMPMLFAAFYFGSKKKWVKATVPLLCMAVFVMHPEGRNAWFYSLYWLIPFVVSIMPRFSTNLFLKSLGATFGAHAVGSAIWAWTVPMTAVQWAMLVPITLFERVLFALGIAGSYAVINFALETVSERLKWNVADVLFLDRRMISRVLSFLAMR